MGTTEKRSEFTLTLKSLEVPQGTGLTGRTHSAGVVGSDHKRITTKDCERERQLGALKLGQPSHYMYFLEKLGGAVFGFRNA